MDLVVAQANMMRTDAHSVFIIARLRAVGLVRLNKILGQYAGTADDLKALDINVRRQHLDAEPIVDPDADYCARLRLPMHPGISRAAVSDAQNGVPIGRIGVSAGHDIDDVAGKRDRLGMLQGLERRGGAEASRRIAASGTDPELPAGVDGDGRRSDQRPGRTRQQRCDQREQYSRHDSSSFTSPRPTQPRPVRHQQGNRKAMAMRSAAPAAHLLQRHAGLAWALGA